MNNDILIALDDGHGMETAGKRTPYIPNLGRFIHENEFNKEVVKYLDIELKRCGFNTLLVASTDDDTSLANRVKLANDLKANAYISIHYNAIDGKFDGEDKDASGIEVFHYPNSISGKRLAECVYNELIKGTPQKQRGVKSANFYVLRNTNMVAMLSENGFMDNEREANFMLDVNFQKEVAREHCRGICTYFNKSYIEETSNPTIKPEIPEEEKLYRVQVGAYRIKENAEMQLKKLNEAGFNGFIIEV